MISIFVWVCIICLVLLAAIQWVLVAIYCGVLKRVAPDPDRSFQPRAAVVLCLRGADPFLTECVRALLNQKYQDFTIFCIVDSEADPSRVVVQQFDDPRIRIVVAGEPNGKCGLKNNALVTAFGEMPDDIEVVALVDADTVVDEQWLADLVAPLSDDRNVVTTGNRWYTPTDGRLGTLIRYIWYLAGSVQMYVYKIPWGGSLAMRRRYVIETDLLHRWSRSLFEDTLLAGHTQQNGKQIAMVPRLLIPNSESIDYSGMFQWMRRQLLNTRLYHKRFSLAAIHCLTTITALVVPPVVVLICLLFGYWRTALLMSAVFAAYLSFYYFVLIWLENRARKVMEIRFSELSPKPSINVGWLVFIIVTQITYFAATMGAIFQKVTRWRGVTYVIRGPLEIQLVQNDKDDNFYTGDSPEHLPNQSKRQSIER